ncbi:MAG: hypothetical protein Q7U97_07795 [Rhodocyclaceae bacterium]|nr:hypothetical protein [Rhodocyclaceae bacterium]
MHIFDSIRSISAGMRASAVVGRGFKLRDRGDLHGALMQAHAGLALLNKPYVRRGNPVEGSSLASLTILADQVAVELHVQGASAVDLADSIAFLNQLKGDKEPELCSFLPFLENRLAAFEKLASS